MISKLRSLSIILCCALSLSAFTGCGRDDNNAVSEISESESSVQEKKIIEYKTVEPPEGGWTTEEIMNVTYLCDHKLNYPLSIEYLGDDFSLSSYSKWSAKKRLVPASLSYKGNKLANATVVKPDEETMIYNIVLFPDTCEVEDTEPFVINGVKMYDSFGDVLSALGDDYRYKSDDSLMYNDRETNESLYSFFFEDGKLVHINVDFRFEIDLPLYKDLYERNAAKYIMSPRRNTMKIGDEIKIKIDRPIGSYHPEYTDMRYPVNYGYVEGIIAPDGEEQDVYLLGVDYPVKEFTGRIIAIIKRNNDIEDKWVAAPEEISFTKEEIWEKVSFQEQYFDSEIIMG